MSQSDKTIISPIAIDLGAKNTGVYFAHYKAGSPLKEIEKEGKVYQLEKNKYTLLMVNRTAKRHQRRGFDRRQMAKRLFKLIWEKHFGFKWDKDVQQTISFLMNRRGFTFLTEQYDTEILSRFPKEVHDLLPDEIKKKVQEYEENDAYNFDSALKDWAKKDEVKSILKALKIRENSEETELKKLILDFKTESFKLENKNFKTPEQPEENAQNEEKKDYKKDVFKWKQLHLQHLVFAIYKTHDELESGGRHRSKYFKEVEDVLNCDNHNHGYLRRFCKKLDSQNFNFKGSIIEVKTLSHLISHISNLELKPLRKYFNDEKHKKDDYWHENRLRKIFERWILHQWRVDPEKNKDKAEDKDGDYRKLCEDWKSHEGELVDFWLKTNPLFTIPPYQNNNNRRPPKCQSLILNVKFLNRIYPKWRDWLEELKKLDSIKFYLGLIENQELLQKEEEQKTNTTKKDQYYKYEKELKEPKSGKGKSYFNDEEDSSLKSKNKRRTNFSQRDQTDLETRTLQFIFDRVKDNDLLKLNEIYSHAKKIKQLKRDWKVSQQFAQIYDEDTRKAKEELDKVRTTLEETLEESKLSENLKIGYNFNNDGLFPDGSFLHLICKYYKLRKRAKEGRLFIHPEYRYKGKSRGYENTGRFDDKNHLLTYCNHKPRQKRYQMFWDLAGLFQVSSKTLKEFIEEKDGNTTDEKLFNWLKDFNGLKSNCEKAAKEQKDRRGSLKSDIQSVFNLISYKKKRSSHDKELKDSEIKIILENSKVKEAFKLYKFCNKAKRLALQITENLYDSCSRQKKWKESLDKNPATAVFFLAQINNLVFKERNGNAKTCPVCSADNAHRMQQDEKETSTKAQRLSAISTRIIDGAVMKMARIVSGAIANDKWEKIKGELGKGNKVCIPIITESNRFEFEPNLKDLKGKKSNRNDKTSENIFSEKKDRIRQAGNGISPYSGDPVGDQGDLDHIIPRSHRIWGTLNDEANLIFTSQRDNRTEKGNNEYSLENLNAKYKREQFETDDKEKIQEWIIDQIGDGTDEDFKFGKYRSFINLTQDQKKAFRHALFLDGHSLRKKVIKAINNRTRALVNGTQRYFAEALANTLYKKAKFIKKETLLSFDYFGVEAQDNSRGDGIYNLRKELVEYYKPDLKRYNKTSEESQDLYSHLIDAQVAFCMVADAHRKEGSLKLCLTDDEGLWSCVDRETGEIVPEKNKIYDERLFNFIQIDRNSFKKESLIRKKPKPKKKNISYRPLFNENAVAMHFLKLIQIDFKKQKQFLYLQGFLSLNDLKECLEDIDDENMNQSLKEYEKYAKRIPDNILENTRNLYLDRFKTVKEQKTGITVIEGFGRQKADIRIYSLNKTTVYNFLIEKFNSKKSFLPDEEDLSILKILEKSWYFTKKENVLKKNKTKEEEFNKQNVNKFKYAGFINPQLEYEWKNLENSINENNTGKTIYEKVENHFLHKKEKDTGEFVKKHDHEHQKVRKVFSLPIRSQKGFLIKKKNWKNEDVFYCRPASNDFSQTVLHKNPSGNIPDTNKDERLSNIYRKSNIFYIADITKLEKQLESIDSDLAIDPNKYYNAEISEKFKDYMNKIKNKRTEESRSQFRFYLTSKNKMDFETFKEFISSYPFRTLQDLKAKYREQYIDSLQNEEDIEEKINEIEQMENKPKNLLPTLKQFHQFWRGSQKEEMLEYSAKHNFTLSASDGR